MEEGTVWVEPLRLLEVLWALRKGNHVILEGVDEWLSVNGRRLPVLGYNLDPEPPGDFQVFPVTDTGIHLAPPDSGRLERWTERGWRRRQVPSSGAYFRKKGVSRAGKAGKIPGSGVDRVELRWALHGQSAGVSAAPPPIQSEPS
jgi:hypothetical protein